MTRSGFVILALLALCGTAAPAAASDFELLTATGLREPGIEPGQTLAAGAVVRLEPWGRVVFRETGGCEHVHVVAGASEHRLAPVTECAKVASPGEIVALVQQGAAFAAPLAPGEEANQLAGMLAAEPCVFLNRLAGEGGNARRCPSGYGLRGMRCTGDHCANKDLLCCPYLGGAADDDAKEVSSRVISEEFPNVVQSKKNFMFGLACDGDYCDNILPYVLKSPRLKSDQQCDWSPSTSEGAWLDCGAGKLAAGLRCRGDWCGELNLYCCGVE